MNILNGYIQFLGKQAEGEIERKVQAFLPRGSSIRYLDCGCDDGLKTLQRANYIGTKRVFGIESIPERAKKAQKNGIKVFVGDLSIGWPIKSQSIDCITATEVIEHLSDLDNFFAESRRVLKPGGSLIVSTENLAAYINILALAIGNQPYTGPYLSRIYPIGHRPNAVFYKDTVSMSPHLSVMTSKALRQILAAYSFKIKNFVPVAFYPLPMPISSLFSYIDKNHSSYVVVKAVKS